jgi:hypothetical protein
LIRLEGLAALLALIALLVFTQRKLHREIQATFLLLTRQADIAMLLFSLLFLPGILLHEFSHWFTARLVGVRTGRFSVWPQRIGDGRLRLGYVVTEETDFLRDALIGAAPLIAGGIFISYAGYYHFNGTELRQGLLPLTWEGFAGVLDRVYRQPDFWLWFYLTLAVSSTMFPSSSDRRAWLPLALVIALIVGGVLIAGAGPWLAENALPFIDRLVASSVFVLSISFVVQLILLVMFFLSSRILMRVTGLRVA